MGYPIYNRYYLNQKFPFRILILFLIIAIAGASCKQQSKQEGHLPSWSSNNVLAIPYFIRQQKVIKGNLVRNSSFEQGKWFTVDSLHKSYSIDAWQQTGEGVQWVDRTGDTLAGDGETYSGVHAIKISRTTADEIVENGEGIVSGFIRVIPGKYSFSFYTRLEDIRPYSARLGTRMHDAVEVKIMFYDKNKIPIDSRYLVPYKNTRIDNSFKALSFASFDHIRRFGWGRIIGKSYSFPFSEGDIPDDTRYVKLFIGLKGTGTMWIDDVDFHYTKDNFTTLERFNTVMDSVLTKQDLIIPTPKKINRLGSVILYKKGQDASSLPVIIIPAHPDEETRIAAGQLQHKIIDLLNASGADLDLTEHIKVKSVITPDELNRSVLVFSIGTNTLYNKYKDMLPLSAIAGHEQGYFIYTSNDLPNVIFLAGISPVGDYYATATVLQLFDSHLPVIYNARIIDFPDTYQRFFNIHAWNDQKELNDQLNIIHSLLPYKLNGAYITLALDTVPSYYLRTLESFGSHWADADLFHFIQWIIPADANLDHHNNKTVSRIYSINAVDPRTDNLIKKIIGTGKNAHSLALSIAPSIIYPEDSTLEYNVSDVLKLTENFSEETRFMADLQQYMRADFPDQELEYCLPWYNNELVDYSLGYADVMIAILKNEMKDGISFLWSGSSYYTIKTDAADIYRYESIVKAQPVMMDNSMLTVSKATGYGGTLPCFPHKIRLYNFIEPYSGSDLGYYGSIMNNRRVFINQSVSSELGKIKLMTALDFYWNRETYDMDLSLWKILVSLYGKNAARELIIFGDALAEMLEINMLVKQNDQLNKNYRMGMSTLLRMKEQLDTISGILGKDNPLVIELNDLYKENKDTFETLYKNYVP
jgi:hypothetical protein